MHYHSPVFKSGSSLAVRIPKRFHFDEQQAVEMFMRHGELIIRVVPANLYPSHLKMRI